MARNTASAAVRTACLCLDGGQCTLKGGLPVFMVFLALIIEDIVQPLVAKHISHDLKQVAGPGFKHGDSQLATLDILFDVYPLRKFLQHGVDTLFSFFRSSDNGILVYTDPGTFEIRLDEQRVFQVLRG